MDDDVPEACRDAYLMQAYEQQEPETMNCLTGKLPNADG